MFRISETEIKNIEKVIDKCQEDLEPLNSFILPGGGRVGGYLHQCRTVCRRAERAFPARLRGNGQRLSTKVRQPVERSVLCPVALD